MNRPVIDIGWTIAVLVIVSGPARGDESCSGPALGPCSVPETPAVDDSIGSGSGNAGISIASLENKNKPKPKFKSPKTAPLGKTPLPEQFEYSTKKILASKRGQMLQCYQKALDQDQSLGGGSMAFELAVSPTGKVDNLKVVNDELQNKPLTNCLKSTLRHTEFMNSDGELITFSYSFVLEPPKIPGQSSRSHPFLIEIGPTEKFAKVDGTAIITPPVNSTGSIGIANNSSWQKSGYAPAPKTEKDFVLGEVDLQMEQFEKCYAKALKKSPELGGQMLVEFKVDKKGKVVKVTRAGGDLGNKALEKCVLGRFSKMKFHVGSGKNATWQVPLRFKADRLADWPEPAKPIPLDDMIC